MNRKDAKKEYADIIGLPHRQSAVRRHMPLHDRAAQFAPFAALTGYDAMIAEEARLTSSETELSESEIEALDRKLAAIGETLRGGAHPYVVLTYFEPDAFKAGGAYETVGGFVKKLDTVEKKVVLYGGDDMEDRRLSPKKIDVERIKDIRISGRKK